MPHGVEKAQPAWRGVCERPGCPWLGEWRDRAWWAAMEAAQHDVDLHGGRSTRPEV